MLLHLYIKNYALIDELDIDLHRGFTAITGETGAGKSIILGALGLLMGRRAESRQVKQGEKKCTIEAHFSAQSIDAKLFEQNDIDYEPDDTILRREVTAAGKSRAFVNDTPVALGVLRDIAARLIDIHSQHQNLLLERSDFQLSVLDIIAKDNAQKADYQQAYAAWRAADKELQELQAALQRSKAEEDFMRYQLSELNDAALRDGEQAELEAEATTLEHAEDIKTALYEADTLLSGGSDSPGRDAQAATEAVRSARQALDRVTAVYPQVAEAAERLQSVEIELTDIASDISRNVDSVDFDPQRLDAVNSRLDRINTLLQKYRVDTEAELLAIHADLKRRVGQIDHSDEAIADLRQRAADLLAEATAKAATLTRARQKAAKVFQREMLDRLVPLGLPKVRFEVELVQTTKDGKSTDNFLTKASGSVDDASTDGLRLTLNGADEVQFLFSANTSSPVQPVATVASGGEIARVMLSLKALLAGAAGLPTIIFDEIDTGVSGKIAQKMAQIMAEMAGDGQQVISITHLPQIAATASHHYKVEKTETESGTESRMRELTAAEREDEIAQMLSGDTITEAARENARALLGATRL